MKGGVREMGDCFSSRRPVMRWAIRLVAVEFPLWVYSTVHQNVNISLDGMQGTQCLENTIPLS